MSVQPVGRSQWEGPGLWGGEPALDSGGFQLSDADGFLEKVFMLFHTLVCLSASGGGLGVPVPQPALLYQHPAVWPDGLSRQYLGAQREPVQGHSW